MNPIRDPLAKIDLDKVAYALARVIALEATSGMKLDALGKASAAHTMAMGMVSSLQKEVTAVVGDIRTQLREIDHAEAEACLASGSVDPRQATYEARRRRYVEEVAPIISAATGDTRAV